MVKLLSGAGIYTKENCGKDGWKRRTQGTAVGRDQIGPRICLLQGLWTTLTVRWGSVPDRAFSEAMALRLRGGPIPVAAESMSPPNRRLLGFGRNA